MARTLTEIYTLAKDRRNEYLRLTEVDNTSKMSILDAFTWTTSACIWTFETLLDVFKIDLARDLQNRINGTPAYYVNALLKYQSGDELQMNDDGTAFSYPTTDETKRIVTKASYAEYQDEGFYDKRLLLKIATGEPGNYRIIDGYELLAIRAYIGQIAFAGTQIKVVSRNGDVLIPRLTVFYDGAVGEEEVYQNIEKALDAFIAAVEFNGVVYVQKVIDAIQRADHVSDVYIDTKATDAQGIFVAQYDDDNNLIADEHGNCEQRIERVFTPNSGYLKQSTKSGKEAGLQLWRESILLKTEAQ
jgi:hypothetical protein